MGRIILLATGERLVRGGVRAFNPVIAGLLETTRREIQIAIYRIDARNALAGFRWVCPRRRRRSPVSR
jgi:hypothetical protein